MLENRRQRNYDPQLIQLVRDSGDITMATRLGVPRNTAAGWLRRPCDSVFAKEGSANASLRRELFVLQRRPRRLTALVRIAWGILRVLRPDFSNVRFSGADRKRILDTIDHTRPALTLRRALRFFGVSRGRFHAWKSEGRVCQLIVLRKAASIRSKQDELPTVLADAGVEDFNKAVDQVVDSGLLRRVLA